MNSLFLAAGIHIRPLAFVHSNVAHRKLKKGEAKDGKVMAVYEILCGMGFGSRVPQHITE